MFCEKNIAERAAFLRENYYIKRIQFNPAIKLFSPRVLLYDGNGYLYISEDGGAQIPHRFIKLSIDGKEAKVLSTNRFYTGLWQEKRSRLIYASLLRVGKVRVSKIDVLDPEGRIIETIDISTEKLGSVYGPQRISGDDAGNLYLVDRYTDRLIHYQCSDFTGCEIFDLSGLYSISDLMLADDKVYVTDLVQSVIGKVCTKTKKVSLIKSRGIEGPRRLDYDSENKEVFVICNTCLLKLDRNFNVVYRYNSGQDFIRDIQFANGCGIKRLYMATADSGLSCYSV